MSGGHGAGAGIRVFLVDGHRMVAETLTAALAERPGIRTVGIAGSIADARVMVARLLPDVLLLDELLPDGTGSAAARELIADVPHLNVIILIEGEDADILADALDAGCSGCISKSASLDELVGVIQSAHAGKVLVPAFLFERVMTRLRQPPKTALHGLTRREVEVLQLLSEGWTTRAMAAELHVTYHTIRNYVQAVVQKLETHSRLEAVTIARRDGIVSVPKVGV
jgi:DNA-binding NarL/FixJ family response regulator